MNPKPLNLTSSLTPNPKAQRETPQKKVDLLQITLSIDDCGILGALLKGVFARKRLGFRVQWDDLGFRVWGVSGNMGVSENRGP